MAHRASDLPAFEPSAAARAAGVDVLIATRESRLALWQAEHVRDRLRDACGLRAGLVPMTTRGDQVLDRALSAVGGKGLFVKELEVAMAEGRADLAVHSLKDVPMALPDGFRLACITAREDTADAFVSSRVARWQDLPHGARVGTSSLRRVAQLRALRPDLVLEPLRGNLDTRLRKLDDGAHDAIVLAAAGLERLGLGARIRQRFAADDMLPAGGQGALGIEVRADAHALRARLAPLDDRATWATAHAERALSRVLGGSCSMPLAAHANWVDAGTLELRAVLGAALDAAVAPDAASWPLLRASARAAMPPPIEGADAAAFDDDRRRLADAAEALGRDVAAALHRAGAARYLGAEG